MTSGMDIRALVLSATGVTALATLLVTLLALPVAFGVGLARLSPWWPVRVCAASFAELTRGSSALVELFWAFYVLPSLGIMIPAFQAGVLVLALNAGAYGSEIVRGAVRAVPRSQWEAATALNISSVLRMTRIILPQAIPVMLPSIGNLLIDVLKATSLLSLVTVTDITRQIHQLGIDGQVPLSVGYSGLLVIYFLLSLPIMYAIRQCERFTKRYLPAIGET